MDKIEISKFIDKTISKTKSKDLHWRTITENDILKPLPDDIKLFPTIISEETLSKEDSYIATFNTGMIVLLVFRHTHTLFISTPPEDCTISLRVQDAKSKYSTEIVNSNFDTFNATELVRLYNLIDKDSSSVSALIDDFLNS